MRISNKVAPKNLTDIQYSIPYCMGLVALVGRDMLLPLTVQSLGHDNARKLAERVTLRQCEDFNAAFPAKTLARVTVVCGGERFVSAITEPKGEASDPLTWQETRAKFKAVSRWVADDATADALLDAIEKMRDGSMDELTSKLSRLDLTRAEEVIQTVGLKDRPL